MSENTHEDDWQPFYWEGRQAYSDGLGEDTNPYSAIAGRIMARCAWAAGWHDKRRECGK